MRGAGPPPGEKTRFHASLDRFSPLWQPSSCPIYGYILLAADPADKDDDGGNDGMVAATAIRRPHGLARLGGGPAAVAEGATSAGLTGATFDLDDLAAVVIKSSKKRRYIRDCHK